VPPATATDPGTAAPRSLSDLRLNLLRRRDSGPYEADFSLHRPTMRLKIGLICPRSPTRLATIAQVRQAPSRGGGSLQDSPPWDSGTRASVPRHGPRPVPPGAVPPPAGSGLPPGATLCRHYRALPMIEHGCDRGRPVRRQGAASTVPRRRPGGQQHRPRAKRPEPRRPRVRLSVAPIDPGGQGWNHPARILRSGNAHGCGSGAEAGPPPR
jgi:hypothetical protein